MSRKTNGVKFAKSPAHRKRRENALHRLEVQLTDGLKTVNEEAVPLTDKDIKRIEKEIEILESRI